MDRLISGPPNQVAAADRAGSSALRGITVPQPARPLSWVFGEEDAGRFPLRVAPWGLEAVAVGVGSKRARGAALRAEGA